MTEKSHFQLGDLNIVCTDLDASLQFYTDVLFFEILETGPGFARLIVGNQHITLLSFAKGRVTCNPYGAQATFSMDLMVSDLKKTAHWLKSNKVLFAKEYQVGERSIHIYDPDNLIWEIIETKKS